MLGGAPMPGTYVNGVNIFVMTPLTMARMVVRPVPCRVAADIVDLMAEGSVGTLPFALKIWLMGLLFPLAGSLVGSSNKEAILRRFWLFWDEGMVCTALVVGKCRRGGLIISNYYSIHSRVDYCLYTLCATNNDHWRWISFSPFKGPVGGAFPAPTPHRRWVWVWEVLSPNNAPAGRGQAWAGRYWKKRNERLARS